MTLHELVCQLSGIGGLFPHVFETVRIPDDDRVLLHQAELTSAQHVGRLARQDDVERDDVRSFQQRVEVHALDAELRETLVGDVRVVGYQAYLPRLHERGVARADAPEADDPDGQTGVAIFPLPDIRPHQHFVAPTLPSFKEAVAQAGLLEDRQHHRHGRLDHATPANQSWMS